MVTGLKKAWGQLGEFNYQPLAAFLLFRVFVTLFLIFVINIPALNYADPAGMPVDWDMGNQGFRYLVAPWYQWDTEQYLQIASNGYTYPVQYQMTVWPPLYPALIRFTMLFFPNMLVSALIVSNLAALAGFYLLYILAEELFQPQASRRILLLLASFPTAFFLLAGYSESLFLALAAAFFLALRRKKILLTGLIYALAVLSRLTALVLILPFAWIGLKAWKSGDLNQLKTKAAWIAGMSLGPISFAGFALFVHVVIGAPWPWESLGSAWQLHFGAPWEGILSNFNALVKGLQGYPVPLGTTFYDLALSFWAIFWLVAGRKALPFEFILFGWAILLLSMMKITEGHLLVSMSRYVLILIPAFLAQAASPPRKLTDILWFLFATFSQLLFILNFCRGYWVG